MANGKYLNVKKPQTSKNRNYNPKYAHPTPVQTPRNIKGRKTSKKYRTSNKLKKKFFKSLYNFAVYMENAPKFKMKRKDKQKIRALLAAGVLTVGMFKSCRTNEPEIPEAAETTSSISTEEVFVPETTEPEIIYTIGVPNKDAEIIVEGKNYTVDPNSFIMINGNEALAYDTVGNFLKGYINSDDFIALIQMSSKDLENYNISQVISDTDVNVRSSGEIRKDNIISTVPSGDFVLSYKPITPENDKEWISTISINDGKLINGKIREDMLKTVDSVEELNARISQNMENIENMMMVDTAKDGYIPVKLRRAPQIDTGNILTQIPYGAFVQELGERTQSGNKNWTLVKYQTLSGTEYEGWVVSDYLNSYVEQNQTEPTIVDGISVNSTGNVTVIDISTLKPDDFRELLQKGIPSLVNTEKTTFNGSIFSNDISGVIIKIGGTAYGSKEFTIPQYDNYIEQVSICEELGIPYGFYYYTASITEAEAKNEIACIEERINSLYEMFDMKYNQLGLAVDIELANTKEYDRQRSEDEKEINERTEAKATLINGLQQKGLSDNILIYGPLRVMKSNSDQIIDLEYLRSLLLKKDNVHLWLSSVMDQNGDITEELKNDIAYAKKLGFSTVSTQLVLDAMIDKHDEYALYDISNMNFDYYKKQVSQGLEKNEVSYSFDITTQDDER